MKIRYFFAVILATIAMAASAQTQSDPMYMVLTMRDGQLKAVNLDEISRLTFPNGKMNVEKKDASSEQIVLTDISNMEFSNNEMGGVEKVSVAASSLAFSAKSCTLQFNGILGQELAIYDAGGALVLRHITAEGANAIDLSALANGVYIVTYNGNTLKFIK